MHQIQVGCITRHALGTPFFDDYVADLVARQRLIASATSEMGVGGDLRTSIAAATPDGDALVFEKKGPTVSYGAQADDLLTTVRRSPDADGSDQVLVLTRGDEATLEQTSTWDSLGMRGTCSPGYAVSARVTPEHVLPVPFGKIAVETMVPFSHILWAHVWLGIATAAYDRARAFVRAQAGAPGTVPPTATRLSVLVGELQAMRAELTAATDEYTAMIESDVGDRRHPHRRLRDPDQHAQDQRLGARAANLHSCAGYLRHGGLQERHALQRRPPPARLRSPPR